MAKCCTVLLTNSAHCVRVCVCVGKPVASNKEVNVPQGNKLYVCVCVWHTVKAAKLNKGQFED